MGCVLNNRGSNIKGISLLLTAAFIWGVAFAAQTAASAHLSAFSYTSIRYLLGAVTMIPVILIFERGVSDGAKRRRTALAGAICGAVLFLAIILQQYGIQLEGSSGKAGFITSLYILIVPFLGLFMGRRPGINVWLGIAVGLFGMYMLTVKGDFSIRPGDALVMCSALFWALHILTIDHFARDVYAMRFSAVQYLTTGLLSGIFMLIFDHPTAEAVRLTWLPLLVGGPISVGIGYTLQTVGQKFTDPVPASLALSMESVFAALAGALVLGERIGVRGYIGCVFIFVGILSAQIPWNEWVFKNRRREGGK